MVGGGDDKNDVDDEGGWYSVYATAIYLKLNDAAIDATSRGATACCLAERKMIIASNTHSIRNGCRAI